MVRSSHRTILRIIAIWTLLLLGACSVGKPQPLQFNEAAWSAGETSLYQVTDLNDQYAGTVQWSFTAPDSETWRIDRLTDTQGDVEQLQVTMAAAGFRPTHSSLVRESDAGGEQVDAEYSRGEVNLTLTTKEDVTTYERVNVPSDSRDARSLFMLIRSLPLQKGYATRINTFLPIASLQTRTEISVHGIEEVTTPAGTSEAWKVQLDDGDRTSRAWVAVEAPHQLVKYEDAANGGVFELLEFTPGQ